MIRARDTTDALKVFISYSRKDSLFADRLVAALESRGLEVLIDRRDLPTLQDWERELLGFIRMADTVVFVVSPYSISSKIVAWEVEQVRVHGKRLAPVVLANVDGLSVPDDISRINYLYFTDDQVFEHQADLLAKALNTDIEWIKEHTRIGTLARRWVQAEERDGAKRAEVNLLRGDALTEAEQWISRRKRDAPEPTDGQRTYISTSRLAEQFRANKEKQQIARTRRLQQRVGWALGAVAILVVAAGLVTAWQARQASRREATTLTALAQRAIDDGVPDRAMRLALLGLPLQGSLPIVNVWSAALEAKLRGGSLLSRLKLRVDAPSQMWNHAFTFDAHHFVMASKNSLLVKDFSTGKTIADLPSSETFTVKLSHNGRFLVVGTSREARIYDMQTYRYIGSLQGHKYNVVFVDFDKDDRKVVTVSTDGHARVWNVNNGSLLSETQSSGENHLAYPPSAAVSADASRIVLGFTAPRGRHLIKVFDGATGLEMAKQNDYPGDLNSIALSPDGSTIAAASGGKFQKVGHDIRLIEGGTGTVKGLLEGHTGRVVDIAFDDTGHRLASWSEDGTLRLWDVQTQKMLFNWGHGISGSRIRNVSFQPRGDLIAANAIDGVRVWNMNSGQEVDRLAGDQRLSGFTADGVELVTTSMQNASVWDVGNQWLQRKITREQPVTEERVTSVGPDPLTLRSKTMAGTPIFSADSKKLLTRTHDGWLAIVSLNAKAPATQYALPWQLADVSQDFQRLIFVNGQTALLASVATMKTQYLEGHTAALTGARFSRDGALIVTTSKDGTARVWKADGGEALVTLAGHTGAVSAATFAGDFLLTVSADEDTTRIWAIPSGQQVTQVSGTFRDTLIAPDVQRPLPDIKNIVAMFRKDADGSRNSPEIWNINTGQKLSELPSSTLSAPVDIDEAGKLAAAITNFPDGTQGVGLFDPSTGRQIRALHIGTFITGLKFSPDGHALAMIEASGTIQLVDTASGVLMATIKRRATDEGSVTAIRWSPDGRWLAATPAEFLTNGGSMEAALLWDVELATLDATDLRKRVCEDKLRGATTLTQEDLADPYVGTFGAVDVCNRHGPLSVEFWRSRIRDFFPNGR